MEGKFRTLYFVALLGLALAIPLFMDSKDVPVGAEAARASDDRPNGTGAGTGDRAVPAAPAALSEQQRAAREAGERFGFVETAHYRARLSNLNAGVTSFALKDERYVTGGTPVDVVTTNKEPYYPLGVDLKGLPGLESATFEMQQLAPDVLRMRTEVSGVRVVRKLEAGESPYQLWVTTRLRNTGDTPRKLTPRIATHHYVTRESESGGIPLLPVRSPNLSNGLCHHGEDMEREDRTSLLEPVSFGGPVAFAGVENVYFLNAVAPALGEVAGCTLWASDRGRDEDGEPLGTLISAQVQFAEIELAPGEQKVIRTLAYLGPKTPEELAAAGHSLKQAIQTGWFSGLAEGLTWLLRVIHDQVGNWGLAIILLTLIVKLLLYPLTAKQMQSMARMKELKPEMDRINELYADDREKKGAAIMELYRDKGVNPMAGCFPVLLQLPIWFSLYTSLSTNVELFRAPFALWWGDLSAPDPYFSLPLALGALMFVQQKMSPATGGDPLQQKMMMYMMPGMITSFMLFLPAGLCLYMFTNSALSITQQRVIEARLAKQGPQLKGGQAGQTSEQGSQTGNEDLADEQDDGARKRPARPRPSKAERRSRRGKR